MCLTGCDASLCSICLAGCNVPRWKRDLHERLPRDLCTCLARRRVERERLEYMPRGAGQKSLADHHMQDTSQQYEKVMLDEANEHEREAKIYEKNKPRETERELMSCIFFDQCCCHMLPNSLEAKPLMHVYSVGKQRREEKTESHPACRKPHSPSIIKTTNAKKTRTGNLGIDQQRTRVSRKRKPKHRETKTMRASEKKKNAGNPDQKLRDARCKSKDRTVAKDSVRS